jgi:thiol-disulfide isomerase/thioredoxin
MIAPYDLTNTSVFMGEPARINSDLLQLDKINSFDYYAMQRVILDMTPAMYKAYCQNLQTKDLNLLDLAMKTGAICSKASQVKKFEIIYRYAANIMEYDWNFESAYRTKNNIPREQRTLPIKIDSLTARYYDFVTNEITNNPLAVLSSDYNSYINRLMYLNILRDSTSFSLTTLDIANELQKSGYIFTEPEKIMIDRMREINILENLPERKEFFKKYGKQIDNFFKTYQDTLKYLYKKETNVDNSIIEKYLIEKGIQFTSDEKQLFVLLKENDKKEATIKIQQLYTANSIDSTNKFHSKHNSFVNGLFAQKAKATRTENLQKILGIQQGFATDIMSAQDECRKIVEEMTPASDTDIKIIQQQITTPFIAEYIAICNQQTKAKIESNKHKTGYTINEAPKTEADHVFDSIMTKYKGKVVYVDFWATWCGPCRSGIEQIKPLKEEMADKNVVFVYITNPSSPQNTWMNMVPDIKGEHYRVSNDEWNYLKSKFNISGIPHYVLVGKNGEILSPALGHLDNQSLKIELEKRIKE